MCTLLLWLCSLPRHVSKTKPYPRSSEVDVIRLRSHPARNILHRWEGQPISNARYGFLVAVNQQVNAYKRTALLNLSRKGL